MVTLLAIVKAYLIYETIIGVKVVIQNKDSAYVPPTLMYAKARSKYVNWKDDHM